MKINTYNGFERYQSVLQSAKGAEVQAEAAKEKNGVKSSVRADTVSFSGGAVAKSELSRLTSVLAAEADGAAGIERLDALHSAVQDGSYYVPSGEIADAIFDVNA